MKIQYLDTILDVQDSAINGIYFEELEGTDTISMKMYNLFIIASLAESSLNEIREIGGTKSDFIYYQSVLIKLKPLVSNLIGELCDCSENSEEIYL